nr:hypothetical protein [Tanacetum cinerariifolium]
KRSYEVQAFLPGLVQREVPAVYQVHFGGGDILLVAPGAGYVVEEVELNGGHAGLVEEPVLIGVRVGVDALGGGRTAQVALPGGLEAEEVLLHGLVVLRFIGPEGLAGFPQRRQSFLVADGILHDESLNFVG